MSQLTIEKVQDLEQRIEDLEGRLARYIKVNQILQTAVEFNQESIQSIMDKVELVCKGD